MKTFLKSNAFFWTVFSLTVLLWTHLLWAILMRLAPAQDQGYRAGYFETMLWILVALLLPLTLLGRSSVKKALITAGFAYLLQITAFAIATKALILGGDSYWNADVFGACIWCFTLAPCIGFYHLHGCAKKQSAVAAYLEGLAFVPTVTGLLPIIWSMSSTVQQIDGALVTRAYLLLHGM